MMSFVDVIMNFIFPPRCPGCEAYVEERGEWCEAFLAKELNVHRLPIDAEMVGTIDEAWALGCYQGALRKLIHRLKFQRDKGVLTALHTFVNIALPKLPKNMYDIATAVPLHTNRERERGFNQAELIFASLMTEPPQRLLKRCRETSPQYTLSAKERQQNLKNAFSVAEGNEFGGKRILLVDDIMTTGTTVFECAGMLKKAGAKSVIVLTLASDR